MTTPDELSPLQRATLAKQLGDAQPARNSLLMSFGTAVLDRRDHDHTSQREDWYCLNLAAYMGERSAPVLRRLLDSEAELARLRDELANFEAVYYTHRGKYRAADEYRCRKCRAIGAQGTRPKSLGDLVAMVLRHECLPPASGTRAAGFQPDRGYILGDILFCCDAILPHPMDGTEHAMGWSRRRDEREWKPDGFELSSYERDGWEDITVDPRDPEDGGH